MWSELRIFSFVPLLCPTDSKTDGERPAPSPNPSHTIVCMGWLILLVVLSSQGGNKPCRHKYLSSCLGRGIPNGDFSLLNNQPISPRSYEKNGRTVTVLLVITKHLPHPFQGLPILLLWCPRPGNQYRLNRTINGYRDLSNKIERYSLIIRFR